MKLSSKEDEEEGTLSLLHAPQSTLHQFLRCVHGFVSVLSFPAVNGSEVYMNSCFYGNGTSFVESLFEDFGEQILRAPPTDTSRSPLFCCVLAPLMLIVCPSFFRL